MGLTLSIPFGSYLWETQQPLKAQLQSWVKGGVFPETHKRLKAAGLCDNYKLTPKGKELLR